MSCPEKTMRPACSILWGSPSTTGVPWRWCRPTAEEQRFIVTSARWFERAWSCGSEKCVDKLWRRDRIVEKARDGLGLNSIWQIAAVRKSRLWRRRS
jgi:hypothetical protein